MSELKQCRKCKSERPISQFYKDKGTLTGISNTCKKCKNEQTKGIREILKEKNKGEISLLDNKICNMCQKWLSIGEFTKDATRKDGFSSYCKMCRRLKDIRNKSIRLDGNTSAIVFSTKICLNCEKELDINCFIPSKKCNDGHLNVCNNCRPKKTWCYEKQKASERKYIENNKEKIKQKWRNQGMKINRRIRDSLNHRISQALLSNNSKKYNKTIEALGCSIYFLKGWIEYLFQDGMSWDNYGEWHLDHVKPCSSFDLSDDIQVKQCFSWENIQPLWAKENIKKSNKIDIVMIDMLKKKAIEYKSKISAQVKEGELLEPPHNQDATTRPARADVNA